MTTWKVEFFNEMVEEQTLAFPKAILADFLRVVELIEEFGPAIGRPHTAPLGKGLFEIRAKGREGIGRSIFCSVRARKNTHPPLVREEDTENTSEGNGQSPEKNQGDNRMKRPTFAEAKKKALKNPEIKKEYDRLGPEYDLIRQLLRMRLESGLTQEEMAELLGTKKPNISRLESHAFRHSPRLNTVKKYAEVAGYEMMIKFKRVRPTTKKRTSSRTIKTQV
jgi:DNA-binding XRE family transcriptional regulator